MFYIFKIFLIDIEFSQTYTRGMYNYEKIQREFFNSLFINRLLKKYVFKLNQIITNFGHSIFLGQGIIYVFLFVMLICNDMFVLNFLGIGICLDYIYKSAFKFENLLAPSLNIYYPISFSIFSVTIRITGVFLSLILGVCFLCLLGLFYKVLVYVYWLYVNYMFTSITY